MRRVHMSFHALVLGLILLLGGPLVPSASALLRTNHLLLISRAPHRPQAGGHRQIKEVES